MARDYDSTVARIAGNILSGMTRVDSLDDFKAVQWAVGIARAIVAETKRTEPAPASSPSRDREPEG